MSALLAVCITAIKQFSILYTNSVFIGYQSLLRHIHFYVSLSISKILLE